MGTLGPTVEHELLVDRNRRCDATLLLLGAVRP